MISNIFIAYTMSCRFESVKGRHIVLLSLSSQVTGLLVGMCYEFKVVVSNSQGAGFPSAYSEDLCVPNSKNQG